MVKPIPTFVDVRDEYNRLWATAQLNREQLSRINTVVDRIVRNKQRYMDVAAQTSVPWFVIGVIHAMESNLDFTTHLHNGDPLSRRTVQVPAGRPTTGSPPFSWVASAIDAIQYAHLDSNRDWSVAKTLFLLEQYNGWGYRQYHPSVLSPYLWSYTNHYTAGKYIADNKWSSTAVSGQCGAAAMLRRLADVGEISFDQPVNVPIPVPRPDPQPAPSPLSPAEIAIGTAGVGAAAWNFFGWVGVGAVAATAIVLLYLFIRSRRKAK